MLQNSFFAYVQAQLGLFIGSSPAMVRLLPEHGCGVIAADLTSDAVTSVLDGLNAERGQGFNQASDSAVHELSRVLSRDLGHRRRAACRGRPRASVT